MTVSETHNLQLVRRWYDRRDPSVWADDVEWILPEGFPHGGCFRGKAEIFDEFFPRLKSDWSGWCAECSVLFDSGSHVVGHGTYHAVCNATRKTVHAHFVHLFRVVADKIVHHVSYVDVAAFRAAQIKDAL